MHLIQTIFAFLFALCLLIIIHELGHYGIARLCGVKVLRFSLGMGKVLFSRRFGADQTEWVVSALPLGGYVKMLDLREQDAVVAPQDLQHEFTHQSVWKRIAIVGAGPLANFLLAIVLFSILFMLGQPEPIAKLRHPLASTEAYQAGVRGSERVIAVNGQPLQLWSELRWEIMRRAVDKEEVILTLQSDQLQTPYTVTIPTSLLSAHDLEGDFLTQLGLNLALSRAQLGKIMPDSPAMRSGLKEGDIVMSIDGKNCLDSLDLIDVVRASPGKLLHLRVERAGMMHDFFVTPDEVSNKGERIGKLNSEVRSMPDVILHQDSLFLAIKKAVDRTWSTSVLTLKMIAKMVVGEVSLKNITGPLTIADYAGQTAKSGWISYISFLAFISISLGVMNLLPIPVLDGGHLLYYSLEVFTGRPISPRFFEIAQRVGLAILALLMAIAFFNDVIRLLPT